MSNSKYVYIFYLSYDIEFNGLLCDIICISYVYIYRMIFWIGYFMGSYDKERNVLLICFTLSQYLLLFFLWNVSYSEIYFFKLGFSIFIFHRRNLGSSLLHLFSPSNLALDFSRCLYLVRDILPITQSSQPIQHIVALLCPILIKLPNVPFLVVRDLFLPWKALATFWNGYIHQTLYHWPHFE